MFSNAVKIFTLNKFDIKVDPSWLIIAALVTWSLSQEYFPRVLPNETEAAYGMMAVIAMLGLFASLLLHELAHSVVARQLGVPIKGITLFLFGGVAELDSEPTSARVEFWIAVAGPVMSMCLAFGFWALAQIAAIGTAAPAVLHVLAYLAMINLILALFNCLPAFPLDGGRVLRAYLWHRTGDALAATEVAARSGAVVAYMLMALGVMALFQGAMIAGLWQLMIGAFVLIAARAHYAAHLAKVVFDQTSVRTLMSADPITVDPDMTLASFVNQVMLRHGISFAPVTDGEVLLGHMDRSVLSGIDRENWASTRVGDVFVGLNEEIMVDPDLPVQKLYDRVAQTRRRKFMVVSDHDLLGVITLSDLTKFLAQSGVARHDDNDRATLKRRTGQ